LLLHADDLQPGRCFRKKLNACDKSRAWWLLLVSTGHLGRHGEEEFVDAFGRNKPAEEAGATFMEKEGHAEFTTQKFENGSRRNAGTFERPHFGRDRDPFPFAAKKSLPAWVVTINVRMPGVRNTALVRSTLPLALTITWSGGAVFFKASDR